MPTPIVSKNELLRVYAARIVELEAERDGFVSELDQMREELKVSGEQTQYYCRDRDIVLDRLDALRAVAEEQADALAHMFSGHAVSIVKLRPIERAIRAALEGK